MGPLLFILYINDFHKCLSKLNTINFADDTTLFTSFSVSDNLEVMIANDMLCLDSWLRVNRLSLNIAKSNYMVLSNRGNVADYNIMIRGIPLNRVNEQKFLGVTIDHNLLFKTHINTICGRVSHGVGMMRRVKSEVPQSVLRCLFYSFVHSSYTYAVAAWGSAYPTALLRLRNLVNRGIKTLSSGTSRCSIDEICRINHVLDFQCTYNYTILVKMFKIQVMNDHHYFVSKIQNQQVEHNHQTRFQSREDLIIPLFRLTKCQNSFLFRGIKLWNSLDVQIRRIESLSLFKKRLKNIYV